MDEEVRLGPFVRGHPRQAKEGANPPGRVGAHMYPYPIPSLVGVLSAMFLKTMYF